MTPGARVLGSALSYLGTNLPGLRESARNVPTMRSTKRRAKQLDDAFDRHLDDIKPGAKLGYGVDENVPTGKTFLDRINQVMDDSTKYAGSTKPSETPGVSINPNADRALYAHELGHLASQVTDVGQLVAQLRHNPELQKALTVAMYTLPGFAAAAEKGDNDLDSSIALGALAAAPTLIDEGLATRHGLAIMDKAGVRAGLGQRGKLAGGLLSYLAAPVIAATAGNIVGNQLD